MQDLDIRGARVHNLKDVDAHIPRYSLTVFTGLSGSGKSSLAFDTIYAEGQRRYIETFSSYARGFLGGGMERPDVQRLQVLAEKSWGEAELHLSEQCLYVHAPVTYKNSRLTNNALERHLKVTCTTRNLNTLRRILALVTPDA